MALSVVRYVVILSHTFTPNVQALQLGELGKAVLLSSVRRLPGPLDPLNVCSTVHPESNQGHVDPARMTALHLILYMQQTLTDPVILSADADRGFSVGLGIASVAIDAMQVG